MTQMKTSLQTAVIRIAVMIAAVLVMAGIRPVTAKAASDGFYVNGTTIYDANGNPSVRLTRKRLITSLYRLLNGVSRIR